MIRLTAAFSQAIAIGIIALTATVGATGSIYLLGRPPFIQKDG